MEPLTVQTGPNTEHPRRLRSRVFALLTGDYFWFYVLLIPSILVLIGVVVIPMVFAFRMSLGNVSVTVVGGKGSLQNQFVGLGNYLALFRSSAFWQAFRETFYYFLVSICIELTVGVGLGILMNQPIRGRKFFRVIVFIPWAIPTIVNAMLWGMIFDGNNYGALNDILLRLHLIHSPIVWLNVSAVLTRIPWLSHGLSAIGMNGAMNAMIVGDEWKTLPLVAMLVLAGLQSIPSDYYEAARVEGASPWRQFRSITLPLLGPILTVILILRTMQLLRAFTLIYTLEQYTEPLLSISVYENAFQFGNFGTASAIAFIIAIIALLISFVYIRSMYREEL
ncbi:carbohydrate ABC transporter permease [Alicyclobacillus sp. ALC3]|uniref:carbohydrate ABC transporter permease n=1 Tax=Alicyclobacillus sp. ALC3 TaxID=2796143 RepID=UPI00237994F7|nr:sugar ABC transporter permease [Alicyclobacillus sp. ALC3]WDL98380.1 sugar ABC transporter permease [Alicyclobacillus sp. ALC3]